MSTAKEPGDYDLEAYLNSPPEERLKIIQEAHASSTNERQKAFFEGMMFADSSDLEDHPEWFKHGCACETCLSYGD